MTQQAPYDARTELTAVDLLSDVRAVWEDTAAAMWSQSLAPLLAALKPATYDGMDVVDFGRMMRRAGVRVIDINLSRTVRKGVRLADVIAAQQRYERTAKESPRVAAFFRAWDAKQVAEPVAHQPLVYFVERHGFLKIGTTRNLATRVASLDRGCSAIPGMTIDPVNVLAVMPGGVEVERSLHLLFADLRYGGEWFLLDHPLTGFVDAVAAAEWRPL